MREDALKHLSKAREFLDAADLELHMELHTAAASSAVLAGINAKDAICLRLTGRTGKSDDHRAAVPELAAAGPSGKALESTFRRLLGLKTAAQYQAAPISRTDATKAVEWATRMVDAARDATHS
ncbi:HEPN domain-containing protein [Cellulomonas oligotrophica]|uniref:Uncharacterized protein (UPF0332 family) n=1 Tax=Cellulomonas oligotrophica TaxID=931536 RepID=A0A7Y9JX66_9CELL|nr:HEPN domain-containing protein [Cellulomonas oligotrophica]NYD86373.1 uncharacterized protein (UPF0332 family) [Cellulomonas oligotrophica]